MTRQRADFGLTRRGLLGGAAAVASLSAAPRVMASSKFDIVATTGMIADAARVVGGGISNVTGLMKAGVDPHAYRQTRSDIVAMSRANLVLWHSLDLEAQMESFFEDLGARQPVVAVAEDMP